MSGFRVDQDAVGAQQKRVGELGTDAARARLYATTNLQLTGDQGLLGATRPSMDAVRTGIEAAIDATKNYLDGSSDGLADALTLYRRTDAARARATDATYPQAGGRPGWKAPRHVDDTRPGPDSPEARKEWEDYQSQHRVDTGPGNPSITPRPAPPSPEPGPARPAPQPTSAPRPQPGPGPAGPASPAPRPTSVPGPRPTPPR